MRPQSSSEAVSEFIATQEERHKNPEKYRGWRTGIADLDVVIGGLQRGWYFIVAGQRKCGKTAFLTTLTKNLGEQGVRVLRVSLEESNPQIMERMHSNVGGVDRNLYRDVALTPETWKLTYAAAEEIKKYPTVWDCAMYTVPEIAIEANKWDVDVIMIDYIQLMSFPGAESRVMEVGSISRALKALTIGEHPRTVVAAAQLNDDGNYLWSRDLGRDCDVAIKLVRILDPYSHVVNNKLKLDIADTRHSEMADFEIHFNGARSMVGSLAKVDLNKLI
jgi:replicative DNA helicase